MISFSKSAIFNIRLGLSPSILALFLISDLGGWSVGLSFEVFPFYRVLSGSFFIFILIFFWGEGDEAALGSSENHQEKKQV